MTQSSPSPSRDPNGAVVAAVRAIVPIQHARYWLIASWALGLGAVTSFVAGLVWCLGTMSAASLRTLAERRFQKMGVSPAHGAMRRYTWLAAAVGCAWAVAPAMSWFSTNPYGPPMAMAMLLAGYMMVFTQFRDAPRDALIVSAPYSAVLFGLAGHAVVEGRAAEGLALIPVVASVGIVVVLINVTFAQMLTDARAERERAREAELEAERARAEAEAVSTAKSAFLANMSHELRTPLNAIIGYSEILIEDAAAENRTDQKSDLDRIRLAAGRLLSMINEILDVSKIEAGRMEIYPGAVDFQRVAEDALDAVRPAARAKSLRLLSAIGPLPEGHTDAFRLGQCVLNLLSNAVKFTREGSVTLAVRAERREGADWIVLAVSDTGIGISDEQLARLFQPFTQADASRTKEFGGTGLGLVLTRRIAQLLGGDVSVTSRPGEGSTFTLAIPARVETPRADADAEAQAA